MEFARKDGSRTIPLSRGMVAIVDASDYVMLSKSKWFVNGDKWPYAMRHKPGTFHRQILMHRLVVGAKDGDIVDHINGNSLDNRKCNLRICTNAQNIANGKSRGGTSKFKGVHLTKSRKPWRASIMQARKKYNLGNYMTEAEAAKAYDRSARERFGQYARLNFPAEATP